MDPLLTCDAPVFSKCRGIDEEPRLKKMKNPGAGNSEAEKGMSANFTACTFLFLETRQYTVGYLENFLTGIHSSQWNPR